MKYYFDFTINDYWNQEAGENKKITINQLKDIQDQKPDMLIYIKKIDVENNSVYFGYYDTDY